MEGAMLSGNFLRACFVVICLPCLGYPANLTVTVKDPGGRGVQGAEVAAVSFVSTNPLSTSFARTDKKGKAVLSVQPGTMYQILATKKGYMPSVRDQVFDWAASFYLGGSAKTKTISLRPAVESDNVRDIKIIVSHKAAPGGILFINLMDKNTFETAGMGFFESSGPAESVCYIYSAQTSGQDNPYRLDVFDPGNRQGEKIIVSNKTGEGDNEVGIVNLSSVDAGLLSPVKQLVSFDQHKKFASDSAGK